MNLKKKLKVKIIGQGKTDAMVHSSCFDIVNTSSSLKVRVVHFSMYQVPETPSSIARYYDNSCLFLFKPSMSESKVLGE
jgi:tRNA A37 threonylcarbamoyladenosine biosynthesis protein TsaE